MPISDCWPELEPSLALLDPPTHKRITSLHDLLLPLSTHIQDYASSLHQKHTPCTLITSTFTWGQSFLVYELVFQPESPNSEETTSWVARFGLPPYEGDEFFNTPEQLERKILNEVGALKIVKERTTVPVPDIFGFCARHGFEFQQHFGMAVDEEQRSVHPLGEAFPAFIMMSAMRGKTIEDCGFPVHELGGHWESPTSDPAYDVYLESPILRRYLASLAAIHVQLSQITFPQIGSFTLDRESGEVRMGAMAEFGLGPFDTAEEYYSVMAEAFKRIAESAVVDEDEDEDGTNSEVVINIQSSSGEVSLPSSEIKTLRRMFTASLFPFALTPHLSPEDNNGPFPLRHGDLHSENILVDEETGEIIGVIDWEGAGTVPWEAAGALNWEVQGEVEPSSLARPDVHGAFNRSLKEIEHDMKTRFETRTRRPKKLQFEESRRISTCSSEYATPPSSMSPSSSNVSLSSTSSGSSSFASFGGTELFSDVDEDSSRHPTHSSSSSRSNLTGATSPPTSPASSLFFDAGASKDSVLEPKNVESTTSTFIHSRFSQTQARILSVFTRTASEPAAPPSPLLPVSSPTKPSHTRTVSLSPAVIESIREPLSSLPAQVAPAGGPGGITSLSLSVAALAIAGAGTRTPSPLSNLSSLSTSPATHAPISLSSSPSTPSTPVALYNTPSALSPRVNAGHRFMHRRKQSSMVLSIPNLMMMNANSGGGSRESPAGSPALGSGSLSLPPFLQGYVTGTPAIQRSRTPSPSPSVPCSPRVNLQASHIRPGAGYHARRPSSFYLPGSLSRSMSGSGSSVPGSGSPAMAALNLASSVRVSSGSGRTWTTAPSSPVISAGGTGYFPLQPSSSSRSSRSGSGSVGSTTTTAASVTTPTLANVPNSHDKPAILLPPGQILESSATSSPGILTSSLSPEMIAKTPSLSMDTQPPVTAPSGMLLSDLHASLGSYVAGYLGHWMYVYACEWETVGRALWDIVEKQGGGHLREDSEGTNEAGADDDADVAEQAFWRWVKDVWVVEQGVEAAAVRS